MKTTFVALGAGILCAAVGFCAGAHTRAFDQKLVANCRKQVDFFAAQPEEARVRATDIRRATPTLELEWRIVNAIAEVEVP